MSRHLITCILLLLCFRSNAQVAGFTADRTTGCAGLLTVNFTSTSTGNISNYQWNFGDGGTSALANPSHTYTNSGTYTVALTVTGPGGSNTSTQANFITVFAVPQASFILSEDTVCDGEPVTLTGTSLPGSGAITQCLWTFNDGSPADTGCTPITHTFINGSSSVRSFFPNLLVVDQNGCNSVANGTVVVTPRPVASFTSAVSVPCTAPSSVFFTNSSTVASVFFWDFGVQGSTTDTSSQRSPEFTYTLPGTYTVTLTAGSAGCQDSATQVLQLAAPQAAFSASDTLVCRNSSIQFIATGTPGTNNWNFGDPGSGSNTASGDTVSHTFNTPGIYNVNMTLFAGGCRDSALVTVRVLPLPGIFIAADDRRACAVPFTVQFYDSTGGATSWSWSFGDPGSGANNTSIQENPAHTYNQFGNYTVSLTVTDTNGCTNSATYQDYIVVAPVAVDFTRADSGCLGKTFQFTALVNSPGDPNIVSYIWNYGDTTVSDTTLNPTAFHTYSDTGIFDVSLTVITSSGCSATFTRSGFIRVGIPPNADFTAQPLSICFQDTVTFLDLSQEPPNITGWQWSFGDGRGSQNQNPVYVYEVDTSGTADPFNVTLIVYHNGCPDTLTRNDYITVLGPKPDFLPVYDCSNPLTVQFQNLSDTLDILYFWNFGDGDSSVLRNPVHTYANRGDYQVTLLDSNTTTGCSATFTSTVRIRVLNAVATATTDTGCAPLPVTFTGSGSQDYVSVSWDFGDPLSGTLNNSSFADTLHQYDLPGNYTVTLSTSDINGCTRTDSLDITVLGPRAGFTASPVTGCPPLDVTFTDTSIAFGSPIVNWSWNFGNGQSSSGNSPVDTATYNTAGNFLPYLTVTDSYGCTSQFVPNLYIRPTQPDPAILLNPNDTSACQNEPISFAAYPGPIVAQPVSYSWNFGDGTTSNNATFTHAFTTNGSYPVTLVATDNNGCSATTVTDILVYTTPASVTITPFDSCVEQNGIRQAQVFVTMTSDSNLYASSYQWDLELTTISQNLSTVFYTYSVPPDTYYVQMILTNQFGCRDTFFDPAAVVVPGPQGTYTFEPDSGCRPLTVTFVGTGSNIDLYTWDFGDGTVVAGTTDDTLSHVYTISSVFTPRFYVGFELNSGSTCYVPTDPVGDIEVTSLLGVNIAPETLIVQEGNTGQVAVQIIDNYNLAPYNFQWDPPSLVSQPNQWPDSFTVSPGTEGGVINLTVPYGNGCSSADSLLVIVIPCEAELSIPNIFTPNGDGKNDAYHIDGLCNLPGFRFIVYNRWGRIVYESEDPGFRWDGTDKEGNPVSDGTYYFVMESGKQDRHGWIQVIRD